MPIAPSSGNWFNAIAKQSAEGTVPTTAEYAFPLIGTQRVQPVHDLGRVAMTDGNAIQADAYWQAGEYWNAGSGIPVAGFADVAGRFLSGMWPTDTPSGTAPTRTHPFTGLGAAPAFWTMWSLPGGSLVLPESMSKGICSGLTISFNENGDPLEFLVEAVGQVPAVVAAPTITVTDSMQAGWFRVVGATLKFEEDSSTPVAHTNIQNVTLPIKRPVTPVKTADGVNVGYLGLGIVNFDGFQIEMVWEDWAAYRSSYYGAVGGSSASAVMVAGSIEINAVHTVEVSTLKFVIPKVSLVAVPPQPDPSGDTLTVTVTPEILKPASGDHVQPTLVNNVTPAY